MSKKWMKHTRNGRIFELDINKLNLNKKLFVKCEEDGTVAGEKLALSNESLEISLENSEAQILDLKRDLTKETQRAKNAESAYDEMAIELQGTKVMYAEGIEKLATANVKISELEGLIATPKAGKPKAKPKAKKKK